MIIQENLTLKWEETIWWVHVSFYCCLLMLLLYVSWLWYHRYYHINLPVVAALFLYPVVFGWLICSCTPTGKSLKSCEVGHCPSDCVVIVTLVLWTSDYSLCACATWCLVHLPRCSLLHNKHFDEVSFDGLFIVGLFKNCISGGEVLQQSLQCPVFCFQLTY